MSTYVLQSLQDRLVRKLTPSQEQLIPPLNGQPAAWIRKSQIPPEYLVSQKKLPSAPTSPDRTEHIDPNEKYTNVSNSPLNPGNGRAWSEVGNEARYTSSVDRGMFADLQEATKGMTPEQLRDYLKNRPQFDGTKITRNGKGWAQRNGGNMGLM